MHIGFDVQLLRTSAGGGIGSYLRSVFDWLCRIVPPHRITPFLYGYPGPEETDGIPELNADHPGMLKYYWDGPPLPLLFTRYYRNRSRRPPASARTWDREVLLPLWQRLVNIDGRSPQWARWLDWVWPPRLPGKVDVYHHVGLVMPPLETVRANVLTIFDLTTLRVPQYHHPFNIRYFEKSFERVGEMTAVITISEHAKQDIVTELGVPAESVFVTPLAAHEQYRRLEDREQVRSVLAKYDLASQPYILHVGTLEPRKNLRRLVEAFHRVKQQRELAGYHLLLVGGEGWMCEPLFETIRQLGLDTQVRWLNFVPFQDLPALMNGADLVAYPSLYEGFGLPPLEAMSCGTPVLVANTTSLPEVVGEAGVLVDPTSADEIAAAMGKLLMDPGLRAALRVKGLDRARQFTWERTARLTFAAYEEAYRRSQGNGRRRPAPRRSRSMDREQARADVIHRLNDYAWGMIHN